MGMNISSGEGEDQLNSTINTTPLVDVMLVLLIVFLIAVPVVIKTVKVDLPNVSNIPTQSKLENIVIAVNKDGDMFWNDALIPTKDVLLSRLREAAPRKPQPEVHIRGDLNARYEYVGRVVAYCQKAGIVRVGFLTSPEHKN